MISRNGVHLPDTTYGGNPIDWNCSSDSGVSLQRLKAENAKLRELLRQAIYAMDDADWASIVTAAIALGVEVEL